MNSLVFILFVLASIVFSLKRGLRFLQYLQQDEYSNSRFLRWFALNRAYDTKGLLVLLAATLAVYFLKNITAIGNYALLLSALAILTVAISERDPRKSGKLKLIFTERAKRIFWGYVAFYLVLDLYAMISLWQMGLVIPVFIFQLLIFQLLPLILITINAALLPLQKKINSYYTNDARRIMTEVKPYVIGITGSYGKTSAKHALGEILNTTLAPTFFTQKGINTVLGITREIREQLKPHHQLAIMEMGAYREDSIKKLCDFTPPNAGIITAIGLAHLERFKTEEAVYRAKSELAKAIPQNGILVCNGDSPGARRMAEEFKKDTTILYGFDSSMGELDCKASNLSFSELGSTFEITWQGKTYQARTKLLGRPIISNILAAFSMACALGANPELALAAIYNLQPVDNRLKLVKNAGITYLQDAYNSNPTGFASALEVLENLKGAQKILMTPGMVELGERQAIENKMVGEVAAKVCSDVIVVGKTNRDALLAGLEKGGFGDKKAAVVDTREEAFSLLNSIQKEGSVILIENDLPDLYEGKEGF